jgi:hypothetical protein
MFLEFENLVLRFFEKFTLSPFNLPLFIQKPASQIPAYTAFVYIAKTIEDYAKLV